MTEWIGVEAALHPVLATLEPVAPEVMAPFAALGAALAEPVAAPSDVPSVAHARLHGHAVRADELVGASPSSPVFLAAMPPLVFPGDPLPPGTDSVLEPAFLRCDGPLAEAIASPAPGEGVRRAGEDIAAGPRLFGRGAVVSPDVGLMLAACGLERVAVRRARVAVEGFVPPLSEWLAAQVRTLGAVLADVAAADLVVWALPAGPGGLALRPGEAGRIEAGPPVRIGLLPDAEGALAGMVALVWPVLARMHGQALRHEARPLAGKVASSIGFADLALLAAREGAFHPLAIGAAPLAVWTRATHVALVEPASEGLAPGNALAAIPLASPLGAEETP